MEKHNSCVNTLAIIEYVTRRHLDPTPLLEGLNQEIRDLDDPIGFLSDPNNWVSAQVCAVMYENARRMTGDALAAYKIGFESVTYQKLGYITDILIKALYTPRRALTRAKLINGRFNRTKEVELTLLPGNQAILRLYWRGDLPLGKDFCLMNKGVYAGLPTIWGLAPGDVEEVRCQFDGDECCEFHASWESLPFTRRVSAFFTNRQRIMRRTMEELVRDKELIATKYEEVASLNERLRQRIEQLLSIQEASSAILSELDLPTLLPAIMSRFIEVIAYDRGIIMLIDQEAGVLRFTEGVGGDPNDRDYLSDYEIPLDRESNILARVAASGKPVITQDASALHLNPENRIISRFAPRDIVILPLKAGKEVIGILAADRTSRQGQAQTPDREYLQGFANQMALAIENARMYTGLKEGFLSSIQSLTSALEAKDPYTKGHSERVALYAVRLAGAMGLSEGETEQIRDMCLVHDIGKIGITEDILNKPEGLSEAEFTLIQQHPEIGLRIIKPLKLKSEALAIVWHHHERYDGRGYPEGLSHQQLPLGVRVATLCDAFDAMTSDRPYRQRLSLETALIELARGAGAQFDPELVKVFSGLAASGRLDDILGQRS